MEQKREFTGVWIPKEILLHTELSDFQKILYADIACFDTCFMLNATFAERYGKSLETISRNISKLVELGYIIVGGFDGRKRYMTALHIHAMQHPQKRQGSIHKNDVSIDKNVKAASTKTSTIDNTLENKLDNTIENNIAISKNRDEIDNLFELEKYDKPKIERPRDYFWDNLLEIYFPEAARGESKISTVERGRLNAAIKILKEIGADPNQIKQRARNYKIIYPAWAFTCNALATHWNSCADEQVRQIITTKDRDNKISQYAKTDEFDRTFAMIEQNMKNKANEQKEIKGQ